ncbi:MAG: uncharacterized protein QOI80_2018 [Solirubrobacteraceae bacterium]|jgi:cytoplasmic iron level regulating protein YaaA (DUF328/UPF0246 family)|nr:uncharacterized protein [Solirubrobacteraceae bacterium]
MLVLLPPSAGKTAPPPGPPVDLAELVHAAELTRKRERLLRALNLADAPAGLAAEVYTGVLYGQLRLGELDRAAWDRVLIASAVFGVVRPGDRICAYKADMGSRVPRLRESLAAYWRPALAKTLRDEGLILDLRSGSYAAAWKPRHATVLGVRGFTEAPDGSRMVITHMAKRVRGDVARIVLDANPETPPDIARLAEAAGLRVELTADTLDVIEPG